MAKLGAGMADKADMGLAAAIEELREELYAAQDKGVNQQFRFEIEEAQLELLLELRKDDKIGGKFRFGVAEAGLDRTTTSARTHKLTLNLKIKDRAVGGRNPEISHEEASSWDYR
ncbi:trypco2 family protein [Streptomyces sp. NPDC021969]|uniref:trypco2 family protein n=1 Tax=unclassified Streptomyces TaxID=2593676 RepID=UPI0033C06A0A